MLIKAGVCVAVGILVALWLTRPGERIHGNFGAARARMLASVAHAYQAEYGLWPSSIDALGGKFLLPEGVNNLVKKGYRLRIEPQSQVIVEWPDGKGELQQIIDIGDETQPEP
ncbi:MAG: hypothetical protein QM783_17645 [Phycisphaerales bacterium]